MQGEAADCCQKHLKPTIFQVGDLVLLNTANYNLQLPSQKHSPCWIGPLKVLQLCRPNTVLIEVPPRLQRIEPIQNMIVHLKAYTPRPQATGPTQPLPLPDLVNDQEEYEVEDLLSHRKEGTKTEYLVRFKGYCPEDDLWLPQRNLEHSQDLIKEYHDRQQDVPPVNALRPQRARRHLTLLRHLWLSRDCLQFSGEVCDRAEVTLAQEVDRQVEK